MSLHLRSTVKDVGLQLRELPVPLIAFAGLLVLTGLAFIHSATTNFSEATDFALSTHATRQLMWASVAVVVFLLCALPDYRIAMRWGVWLFAAAVTMMFACMAFGREINGAKSWIVFGPVSLQVSEFCKPLFVLMLAGLLRFKPGQGAAQSILLPAIPASILILLILLQPDFGTAMIFVPVFLAMCWLSGARTWILGSLVTVGAAILPAAYLFGMFKAYQKARIDTFLAALTGAPLDRSGDAYQVTMSMNALGSGGVSGKGFGDSTLSQFDYLPERHTDFIFSVIGEETGLLGGLALIGVFLGLVVCCYWIAARAQDAFGRLIAAGVGTMLMVQFLLNVGMTCGLTPVTGLPLPLISYGGSSLLATAACLGLVANVHLHPRSAVRFKS